MAVEEQDPALPPGVERHKLKIGPYTGPVGGWGSVKSLGQNMVRDRVPASATVELLRQNKPHGFACTSCAWAKPAQPHVFEFCEEGAKATMWEITSRRCKPDFFAAHDCAELETWPDHDLEMAGRLTHPMRWIKATDHYEPVSWANAFKAIAGELKALDPDEAVFYASGHGSLETAYMFALLARMYGTNNLPDCSNMCHESTSVALPETIGIGVGTVTLDDLDKTDGIFFFGQNVGTSSPRLLHNLQDASRRGAPIVTFNPLRERGLEEFTNPQSAAEMLTGSKTRITSQYHQVKTGGDIAAVMGMCKALIAWDEEACSDGRAAILDHDFIDEHTHGFEEFARTARRYNWRELERRSGLTRGAMEAAAAVYAKCERAIVAYGMGLTQHRLGVMNVHMLTNLLFLRGNIGKEGAGLLSIRGHSNVQGQRTVGISEKPHLVPLDKLAHQFGFEPPREKGVNTVEACEAMLAGKVRAFISLGGNFIRAVPDHGVMEPAWRKLRMTVMIATKLNRSQVLHGEVAYILPCLGRTERDEQVSGVQAVSVEDSTGCVHGSRGLHPPTSPHLLSEPAIVAGIAKATLAPNPLVDWDAWVADYARVRDAIAETYPDIFHDFNARMWQPGGFHRPLGARKRIWNTKTGKANFIAPKTLSTDIDRPDEQRAVLQLITLRSNDQFNTTIYGYDDRLRGIKGTRLVVLMHRNDIDRLGLAGGAIAALTTVADDGVHREVQGLRVTPYDIPEGCCAGYYPECNPLVPLWHHAEGSKVPASKSIPVRVRKIAGRAGEDVGASEHRLGAPARELASDLTASTKVVGGEIVRAAWDHPAIVFGMGLLIGTVGAVLARRRRRHE